MRGSPEMPRPAPFIPPSGISDALRAVLAQSKATQAERLSHLADLDAPARAKLRRTLRTRLAECRLALTRYQTPARRAWLSGYLDEAERALRAASP